MSLGDTLGELLISRNKTIAIAESITGGMISNLITDVPGCSRYFLASIISYSNESKMQLLGVRKETLLECGAVSSETAREMADGVRMKIGSDVGASVTGIAGPSGETESKPIGLVFLCVSDVDRRSEERIVFRGDRKEIKRRAAERLLQDAVDFLN